MEYRYVKVSTISKNIDRQMNAMYKLGFNTKQIYIYQRGGKDFNRENHQKLDRQLKINYLLIAKSIDRLGRDI